MLLNIDVERVANKSIDQIINKIDPNVKLSDEIRQKMLEKMVEQLSCNAEDLERTVENLLIGRLNEKSSELILAILQLSKLFGGINND